MSLPKKIAAIVVAAACLIAAVAVSYSIGYQRGAKGRTVLTETAQSEQDGQTEPTEGDDIQPLEEDIISVLCCGVDNTQELTDVIMYAQFDTRSGKVNVLRIPRDTFVGSQFPTAKINAIYGHPEDGKTGIQTLTDYLRDNWKLDIDYYATIDLASVPGKVLYPGEQTLTGEQAEWIIRYRAGYANGDLGRIDAQTQFIFSCLDRVHELGRLKCIPILMQHYDDVQTDMTLDKMLSVATALFEVDSDDIQMQVVPGTGTMYYSYAVYAVDEQQLVDILNEDFVSSDGEFTAEKLEVASVYGSGSSNRYNSSQSSQSSSGNRYNSNTTESTSSNSSSGQNSSYGSTQSSSQGNTQSNAQDNEQGSAIYQYDEDGNPLYRLDENGDPVYDYDEDGNILYVYEQAEQQAKEQQEQKEKEEEEKKKEEEKSKRPSTLSQANKGKRS